MGRSTGGSNVYEDYFSELHYNIDKVRDDSINKEFVEKGQKATKLWKSSIVVVEVDKLHEIQPLGKSTELPHDYFSS